MPTPVEGLPDALKGEFPQPLAAACHGPEMVWNVLKRPRTVGRFLQVDGLAERLSAFGHGDAGRVLQHAS